MNQSILNQIVKNKKTCYFVSPHLDDAALSAGETIRYLAGKTEVFVINVFTKSDGIRETFSAKKTVKLSKFKTAEELYRNRIEEDRRALAKIKAKSLNLGFVEALWRKKKTINNQFFSLFARFLPELEHIYPVYRLHIQSDKVSRHDEKLINAIAEKLRKLIKKDSVVFCPIAFGHIDHSVTRMAVEKNHTPLYWIDQPYYYRRQLNGIAKNLNLAFEFKTDLKEKSKLIKGYFTQVNLLFEEGKVPELKEIFYEKNLVKKSEFPQSIDKFNFIKEIVTNKKSVNFSYGLYQDVEGNQAFAKLWNGVNKNLDYYWLKNEINAYKDIWRAIKSKPLDRGINVRIPKLYGFGESGSSLYLLIEFIEGERLGKLPSEKKVEVYKQILQFLTEVNSGLKKLNSIAITRRPIWYYLVLFPVISLMAILKQPRYVVLIVMGLIKGIVLFPSLLLKSDIGIVHRDLGDWNIFVNRKQIFILDFQLTSITHRMLEYATIYLKLWNQKEFVKRFSDHKSVFNLSRFQVYGIFLSIYDLSISNGGPEKVAADFLRFNIFPKFDTAILLRNIKLLIETPKDFLYSFTIPVDKEIIIEEYDPSVKERGEKLIKEINKLIPELKVHFFGSSALKIHGQKDIDLFLESPTEKLDKFIPKIESMFGRPIKKKSSFVEWHVMQDSHKIDILLLTPTSPILKMQKNIYHIFMNNRDLLKEYENLKISSNGISLREYDRRQMVFFNKMLRKNTR